MPLALRENTKFVFFAFSWRGGVAKFRVLGGPFFLYFLGKTEIETHRIGANLSIEKIEFRLFSGSGMKNIE